MIKHIVRVNESISDIINNYHITLEELKKYNGHITDFTNIISGTKIIIPSLTKEKEELLTKSDCFYQSFESVNEKVSDKDKEVKKEDKEKENVKTPTKRGKPYPGIIPPNRYFGN